MMKNVKISKDIYFNNEVNANIGLAKGCFFSGIAFIVVWIGYLTNLFQVYGKIMLLINILFPILAILLFSAVLLTKTKLVQKPQFKYFLITLYVLIIFTLNVILPKHGILMWTACILLVNHYFSPKIMLFTFILVAVAMFFSLYFGMFIGEWDPYLLNGARFIEVNGRVVNVDTATMKDRIEWLDYLKSEGDNRYFKAFIYYYLPRLITLTIIENIGIAVSKRSNRLLTLESEQVKKEEKMRADLNIASSIQYSVLPKELKDDNKDNIYGLMEPAREVGGDLYDYFYIDDTHIAFVVADVSGKGIPAALFMMKTETLIKSLAMSYKSKADTAKIMEKSNISLCSNNEADVFVTCWLGILNLNTGELKYTNAGHNKVLLIQNNQPRFLTDKPGVVLGAFDESVYQEHSIYLSLGDKIILYTDGVTEAHNQYKILYGEDRLLKFTENNIDLSVKNYVLALKKDIDDFSTGVEQFDDITILAFTYESVRPVTNYAIFKANRLELDKVFDFIRPYLDELAFYTKEINLINTAIEEVFVNVALYAYKEEGEINVILYKYNDHIIFEFRDNGIKFNPLEKEDPNIKLAAEDREVGGLGIYMVKNIMDDVKYKYENNQNILTLTKYKK